MIIIKMVVHDQDSLDDSGGAGGGGSDYDYDVCWLVCYVVR